MARTVDDWLADAGRATDPADVDRCIVEAAARAVSCHELRGVLKISASLGTGARTHDVADRTLALASQERELWGFRDVAAVRAAVLTDAAGARAALDGCALLFSASPTRGYEWRLLGEGFVEILADEERMRRCLEAGLATAREQHDADDLCELARGWASHVDREQGEALLHEAERLASNGTASPWTIANAWHSLEDDDAVRRVLDRALRDATTCGAAVHAHRAWASHGRHAEALAALERAEDLASTVAEWLTIGEAAFDARLDEAVIRRAVSRAESLMGADEVARGRVSSGYAVWLADEVAAARVGPRGAPPEALRGKARTLEGWNSSASALFDWLRARATPQILHTIANADYGMGAEKHLAALRDICATGLVPRELAWEPHEVIALRRWTTGESVNHIERALCCALLCIAPQGDDELVVNGVILAESCVALGPESSDLAARFFVWCSETEALDALPEDCMRPEQTVALALLLVVRSLSVPADLRLEPLATMLFEHAEVPLVILADWIASSMRREVWRELADRALLSAPGTSRSLRSVLLAITAA